MFHAASALLIHDAESAVETIHTCMTVIVFRHWPLSISDAIRIATCFSTPAILPRYSDIALLSHRFYPHSGERDTKPITFHAYMHDRDCLSSLAS